MLIVLQVYLFLAEAGFVPLIVCILLVPPPWNFLCSYWLVSALHLSASCALAGSDVFWVTGFVGPVTALFVDILQSRSLTTWQHMWQTCKLWMKDYVWHVLAETTICYYYVWSNHGWPICFLSKSKVKIKSCLDVIVSCKLSEHDLDGSLIFHTWNLSEWSEKAFTTYVYTVYRTSNHHYLSMWQYPNCVTCQDSV